MAEITFQRWRSCLKKKPRIFYFAWTPPSENGGACLAMRRHFIEHDDFNLFVATSSPFHHPGIPSLSINRHPMLARLSNTRFSRGVRQVEMLFESSHIPREVILAAEHFKPDAVFTVADNTLSWSAYLLSKKLDIPLISNFQDWWPRGQFALELEKPFSPVAALLESRFHRLYQASKVAFCTSSGMQEKLGQHPCAPILYPCPAPRDINFLPSFTLPLPNSPLKLIYAGTVVKDYGQSILRLARALVDLPWVKFEVYGPHPDWPEADLAWMKAQGIYLGMLPYVELKKKLQTADAFLTVMSFSRELELMMRTSFTSKFLEYVQFAKPVIIWGPEYCQPVCIARETGAGLPVVKDEVNAAVEALESLREAGQWLNLAHGAWSAANGIFDHGRIHDVFRDRIKDALKNTEFNRTSNIT